MGVFKEIARANQAGTTTFYRLDNQRDTVQTDGDEVTKDMFDYNQALNKPSINGVTLVGDKTSEELGLQPAGDYLTEIPEEYITEEELEDMNLADKDYVKKMIDEIEHFHREIVDVLPKTGKDNVLYLVPKEGTGGDVYNEYIWTGTAFEFMGTTAPDLTLFYTKEEANKLLNQKVDKVGGKDLSTNDFTDDFKTKLEGLENYDDTELRNKVNQFHNYDDTEIKKELKDVIIKEANDRIDIDELKEQIVEKLEAVFLIRSGDYWFWQNRKGDNITFSQAQQLLGLENYILVMEYLETDGKITPREYISLDDRLIVYYSDEENKEHILTMQDNSINDNVLGYEVSYRASVDNKDRLPADALPGTICVTLDDENIYLYTGLKWIPANPYELIDMSNYLSKTNTLPYVPSEPFHPATKQYVDQHIQALDEKKVIPTRLSELINDTNFVPRDTVDLVNYYTKNNIYTKNEVDYLLRQIKQEGKINTYLWDSTTYEGNPNDILAMQVLLDEYMDGVPYILALRLKNSVDDFNGLYGVYEFRFNETTKKGHLYMGAGDKYYAYGDERNTDAKIINSSAIVDIAFSDLDGPYVVTNVTLRRKEDIIANYLSTTTTTDVTYSPTLGGHPATKRYVDNVAKGLDNDLTDRMDETDKIIDASIKKVAYDTKTGILTFTQNDGKTQTIDLPMEYLVESGKYNSTTRQLELTLANGDIIYIDAKDLVDEYYADENSLTMNTNTNTFKIKDGYLASVATSGAYSDLKNRQAVYAPASGSNNTVNKITISTANPSGGSSGDIWIQY